MQSIGRTLAGDVAEGFLRPVQRHRHSIDLIARLSVGTAAYVAGSLFPRRVNTSNRPDLTKQIAELHQRVFAFRSKLELPDSRSSNDERSTQFVMGAQQPLNLSHRKEVAYWREYLGRGLLNHDRTLPHYQFCFGCSRAPFATIRASRSGAAQEYQSRIVPPSEAEPSV